MASNAALTVTGAAGIVQTLDFQDTNGQDFAAASDVLPALNAAILVGNLVPVVAGSNTAIPAGKPGLLQVGTGGQYVISVGYSALIDTATTSATVFGGAMDGQLVVAGSSGLAFNAGAGAGTVIAGAGNNLISVLPGAGAQRIITGLGADTIVATFGNNLIQPGSGRNIILARGGNDTVVSTGNDVISIPDGNANITLGAYIIPIGGAIPVRTVFLGSGVCQVFELFLDTLTPSVVVAGSAPTTITSQGADQLWMQAGGGVVNSYGHGPITVIATESAPQSQNVSVLTPQTTQQGTLGADTVIGGTGAITVNASYANDFIFAGPGAVNFVGGQGASTILGNAQGTASITGGAGSLVAIAYGQTSFTGGAGAATIAAFGGSVTINGGAGTGLFIGATTGNNRITAGTGNTTIYGGGAGDVLAAGSVGGGILVAGSGAETLIGGAGADLFAAIQGKAGTLTIQNFTKGQDFFTLTGFTTTEAATALASSTLIAGSQQLTLSDGTKILFAGVTGLTVISFI